MFSVSCCPLGGYDIIILFNMLHCLVRFYLIIAMYLDVNALLIFLPSCREKKLREDDACFVIWFFCLKFWHHLKLFSVLCKPHHCDLLRSAQMWTLPKRVVANKTLYLNETSVTARPVCSFHGWCSEGGSLQADHWSTETFPSRGCCRRFVMPHCFCFFSSSYFCW